MSDYERDFKCREIISRAVCGNGRKFSQLIHSVHTPHPPSNILGAWVMNHQCSASYQHEAVQVDGSYEMNIWYSYDNQTKTDVAKEHVRYTDHVPLSFLDHKHFHQTASVYADTVQHPTCVEAVVHREDGSVQLTVELELQAELHAETKLCVVVCPGGCGDHEKEDSDDEFDDFEDFDDDEGDDEHGPNFGEGQS